MTNVILTSDNLMMEDEWNRVSLSIFQMFGISKISFKRNKYLYSSNMHYID